MRWLLIKKQFYTSFYTYFINPKTKQALSKGGIAKKFILFGLIMLLLCGTFFFSSYQLAHQLFPLGKQELYYALLGALSLLLGTFGSVFNTYATVYLSRDNDLLLSMPIAPRDILLSRMALVFGLSFLYSGTVWIPCMVCGQLFAPNALQIAVGLLVLIFITLLVTTLSCALGWVVALVAARLKNRSVLVVLLSVAFLGIYYYISFNFTALLTALAENAAQVEKNLKLWALPLYQLGKAAAGNGRSLLLFGLCCIGLLALCVWILTRSFFKIIAKNAVSGRKKASRKRERVRTPNNALLLREWRRFLSSPTYMLNCGFGLIVFLALPVLAILKQDALAALREIPQFSDYLPLALLSLMSITAGLNALSTPSVSLEGRSIWLVQSLPVSGKQVLRAKEKLHILFNLFPALLCTAVVGVCLKLSAWELASVCAYVAAFIWANGAFGLLLGLLRPNLTWLSEAILIKQSMNGLIVAGVNLLAVLLTSASCYFLHGTVPLPACLCGFTLLLCTASMLLDRRLSTTGAATFEKLS